MTTITPPLGLASASPVAEVRESPKVAKPHRVTDDAEDEFGARAPLLMLSSACSSSSSSLAHHPPAADGCLAMSWLDLPTTQLLRESVHREYAYVFSGYIYTFVYEIQAQANSPQKRTLRNVQSPQRCEGNSWLVCALFVQGCVGVYRMLRWCSPFAVCCSPCNVRRLRFAV